MSSSRIIKSDRYERLRDALTIKASQTPSMLYKEENEVMVNPVSEEEVAMAKQLIEQAKAEAEQIIAFAKEQSRQMLIESEQKISDLNAELEDERNRLYEEAKQNGYESGYNEGYKTGENKALADFDSRVKQAEELIEEAHLYRRNVISQAEPFLIKLSTAIAERIIGFELTSNPEAIISIVKEALVKAENMKKIIIYVNPDDFNTVQKHREEWQHLTDSEMEVKISPDRNISPGNCIVRSDEGTIDAQIEVQLSQIKVQLLAIAQGSGNVETQS